MKEDRVSADGKTYTDGTGAYRCVTCYQQVRTAAGEPTAPVLVNDIEEIISILEQYVDCPEVWDATIARLRQTIGVH